MTESLETVLSGKALVIKGKQYLSASSYVKPFVDKLKPFNVEFKCLVKQPDQMTLTESAVDIAFTRVNIMAVFPKEGNLRKAIVMAYALDLRTPVAKFYVGNLDENDNFISFDKDSLRIQEIEQVTPINYAPIQYLLEHTDNTQAILNSISSAEIDRENLLKLLGEWINFTIDSCHINLCGKIKLSPTFAVDAYKMLLKDPDSDFYIPKDSLITMLDIYSSLLSLIRDDDKDIINRFEKTILVNNMLRL